MPSNQRNLDSGPRVVDTVAVTCTSGTCPTVYTTDRGTLIIQGYVVEPAAAGISIPDGEKLVEIPVALLRSAIDNIS